MENKKMDQLQLFGYTNISWISRVVDSVVGGSAIGHRLPIQEQNPALTLHRKGTRHLLPIVLPQLLHTVWYYKLNTGKWFVSIKIKRFTSNRISEKQDFRKILLLIKIMMGPKDGWTTRAENH